MNLSVLESARRCARKHDRSLGEWLGGGSDGDAWEFDGNVIKAIVSQEKCDREAGCYLRLSELKIQSLCGFTIPRLIALDDELLIVEMGYVSPPCLINFGKAYLDQIPDYYQSESVMDDWDREGRENFGDANWLIVRGIHASLKQIGIYYMDTRPGNIMFDPADSPGQTELDKS